MQDLFNVAMAMRAVAFFVLLSDSSKLIYECSMDSYWTVAAHSLFNFSTKQAHKKDNMCIKLIWSGPRPAEANLFETRVTSAVRRVCAT